MFFTIVYLMMGTVLVEANYIPCDRIKKLLSAKDDETNAEAFLEFPAIAARRGYRTQTHTVLSDDGYILRVHRMSSKEDNFNGPPVLLLHGFAGSSVDWIINGKDSLGYLLAAQGYDVWLGNVRGNKYSKEHNVLSTDSSEFWDFSFHEMGIYDLPAMVLYIKKIKTEKIVYIAHSMGATVYLIFSSTFPEMAKNVKISILLAPLAIMAKVPLRVKYIANHVGLLQKIFKTLKIYEMLGNKKPLKKLLIDCMNLIGLENCMRQIVTVMGFNEDNFNWAIAPILLHQDPSGVSTKTLAHYGQIIKANGSKFRMFDYGVLGNNKRYATVIPPSYKLYNIQTPIYLMYGNRDPMSNSVNVNRLAKELRNVKSVVRVDWTTFNQIDFLFSKFANYFVYQPILKIIDEHTT